MEAPRLTIVRARQLRRKLTLPEGLLWTALRGRKLAGLRFRRQHPIGPYILDFYCDEGRLAVEVDGQGHDQPDQFRHDQRRTAWLDMRGIAVLRIAARDVLGNLEGVLVTIEQRARASPLHRRTGGPPPPEGEEC
ncbi:endonuclease domain-containing protein [Brevundimonas sp.]|uniref:endonuclease domain-containing protein n=1 Tax=Brevundimonas sp. TaxID=1871086 RepID=UPI001D69D997|nr:endonuclease domain-containing protein [Brevundimonas sp.]MBL0947056.1 endonuclease domain-containing protein [Brevundimonas sp.]